MSTFDTRLRKLRTDKNVTRKTLAEALGVSLEAISKWEIGRNYPNQEVLNSLADYFEVSVDYLLGRTDDPRPFPVEDMRSIDEKIKDEGFAYALYDGARDLTDKEKQELLDLFELIKLKRERDKQNRGE